MSVLPADGGWKEEKRRVKKEEEERSEKKTRRKEREKQKSRASNNEKDKRKKWKIKKIIKTITVMAKVYRVTIIEKKKRRGIFLQVSEYPVNIAWLIFEYHLNAISIQRDY